MIKLSAYVEESDEKVIGAYFHVLNDLERIGDHAENFHEIGEEMISKGLAFSDIAKADVMQMHGKILQMFASAKDAFENNNRERLPEIGLLESETDEMKKSLSASHFTRLADGKCKIELSPYYTSTVAGLERVADHIVNVGYSIVNPVGEEVEI